MCFGMIESSVLVQFCGRSSPCFVKGQKVHHFVKVSVGWMAFVAADNDVWYVPFLDNDDVSHAGHAAPRQWPNRHDLQYSGNSSNVLLAPSPAPGFIVLVADSSHLAVFYWMDPPLGCIFAHLVWTSVFDIFLIETAPNCKIFVKSASNLVTEKDSTFYFILF
jgi:hypothetical protein